MTRDEHLAWAKERAQKYVDARDLNNAVTSMMSDMSKHPELKVHSSLSMLGIMAIREGSSAVRRWIEGFR